MIRIPKACIRKGDRYLVLKRVDWSLNFPGLWDFAGGKPDPGETLEETLIRETMEETCLSVTPTKILGIYQAESRGKQIEFTVYEVAYSGEVELSGDHTEYDWMTKDEILDKPIMPFLKEFFKD